jgi:hypothetical protein
MRQPSAAIRALKRLPQSRWFGVLWMAALLAMAVAAARAA